MTTGQRVDADPSLVDRRGDAFGAGRLPEATLLEYLRVAERVVSFVCARQRLSTDEAKDFASHVTLTLLEDERAILRKFAGRSSIRTYLTVVVQRLLLDYRTAAWGKWRPSAEARRQGETAILIERLLIRDGHTLEEAYEVLTTNHRVEMGRADFERLIARLPIRARRQFEGEDTLILVPDGSGSPEDALVDRARAESGMRIAARLKETIAECPQQDQLILTLRYEDGRSVADIAGVVGEDQKKLYRRFEHLLRDLRQRLESRGISAGDVADLFDAPLAGPDAAEVRGSGPSTSIGVRK